MWKDQTILWIHHFPIFCKSFGFFLMTKLNFTFYYLLSVVCYLPSSEYSQLNDEQYVVQKPMWNVVRALNKKQCSKYQSKVEYKIYREEHCLALRKLYFIELKPTNLYCSFLFLCVYMKCLLTSFPSHIYGKTKLNFLYESEATWKKNFLKSMSQMLDSK